MPDNPETVAHLLRGAGLAALRTEAERQGRLLFEVRKLLPDDLTAHCLHCLPKGERLIIYADSPAWGFQLRFHASFLLTQLAETAGYRFRDVQVRNLMSVQKPAHQTTEVVPPSVAVGELLKRSAETTSSSEIKAALLRLSHTVEKANRR